MVKLFLIVTTAFALIPWGVKRIDKKLTEKDYPTADSRQDNEPFLKDLIAEAKDKEEYLKVMRRIAENKEIWWELRQDAVLYLGSFLKHKTVTKLLSAIVLNDNEQYELRETAYKVLSPVSMAKKAKTSFLLKFAKAKDEVGKIHLRLAKDLAELNSKKRAKEILKKILARPDLDPVIKTDAEEFLKFLH